MGNAADADAKSYHADANHVIDMSASYAAAMMVLHLQNVREYYVELTTVTKSDHQQRLAAKSKARTVTARIRGAA
eukprot:scaffold144588_cov23-Prasinocladus_malaysianus.AAC.1